MPRLIATLSVLLLAASPPLATNLDQVVHKAVQYVATYDVQLGNIVAVEQYVSTTTRKQIGKPNIQTPHRIAADILMMRDGADWYPVRAIRNADGTAPDENDYVHKETVAALGARPRASAFRRSLNLPTVPLTILREANLRGYAYRKAGEERVDGQLTWKIAFDQKSTDRESSTITLWIQPDSGQVLRSIVEVNSPGLLVGGVPDGYLKLRVTVEYAMNRRFNILLPISMREQFEDSTGAVDGTAEYTYIGRPGSDKSAAAAKRAPIPDFGEYKLVVDVPLVSLDVSVAGERGAVTDLKADDFTIYENDVRQTLTTFSPATVPYNILLLFDWSGSTVDKRSFLQQAAAGFIDSMRPVDWVGIGRFAGDLEMEGWTSVRLQASRRMSQLKDPLNSNGTNFYTALEQALTTESLPFVGRRRALVVLTDGRDSGQESFFMTDRLSVGLSDDSRRREAQRYSRLLDIVRQERVPIYLVAVNTFEESLPDVAAEQLKKAFADYKIAVKQRIEEIARLSGGRAVFADTFQAIIPVYKQISHDLGTAYTLGYYSNTDSSTGYRKITVKTKDDRLRVVQSRAGYDTK